MKTLSPAQEGASEEIFELIEKLFETERRLEELTAGEADSVTGRDGSAVLLRGAQDWLRLSGAQNQAAILDTLPANIALIDSQGVIISVNESWRVFARKNKIQDPGYGIGVDYLKICDQAHGANSAEAHQVAKGIREVLYGKTKVFSIEYPCHGPDEKRWFLMTVTPLSNVYPTGAVVMHFNITERHWAEQELKEAKIAAVVRESSLRYSFLADSVPLIIWTARPDGGVDYYNKAWFDYTGLTLEQSQDWGWNAVVHPDDLKSCIDRWTLAFTTGELYEIEYRFKRKSDGSYRWFLGRASPRRNERGDIIQWVGTGTDIDDQKRGEEQLRRIQSELEHRVVERTADLSKSNQSLLLENSERKRVEHALRENIEKFHQLANNISDAFWIRSPDLSAVQYISPAFEQIWGRSAESLYANPQGWSNFILPEDRQRVMDAFAALKGDTRSLEIEYRIVRPSGEIRWVRVRGYQIRDANDVLIRHTGIVADITESKKSQEALRISEAGFRTLTEAMPQIVWTTDPNGECIYFNQLWMDFTGRSLEKSLGQQWLECVHSDDQARTQSAWQHAVDTTGTYRIEFRLRRADGLYRWWLIRGVPQLDSGGAVLKWIGTCTDIHDLKQAELEIANSNQELRVNAANMASAQRIAHFGSWELAATNKDDIDVNTLIWSDEMFRIAGYEPGAVKVTNELFFSMVPPGEHAMIRQAVADAMREHRQYSVLHRLIRPDGEERLVQERAELIFDEETGQPLKIVGTAHDVTDRRRAEDALQRQQSELRALFDVMPAMIWLKDTKNNILRVNQRVADQAGKSIAEIEGKPTLQVYPEQASRFYADDLEVLQSKAPKLGFVETMRDLEGKETWVQTDKVPYFDKQGHIIGIIVMAQDITTRIQAEVALRNTEEQLRQSQKMEAIGQLAGGIAHDFNNLLTVIIGHCEMMLMRMPRDNPMRKELDLINSTGHRAAALTRQMLAFSRQQVLKLEVINLNALVEDLGKMLHRLIPESIDLKTVCDKQLDSVKADSGQIEQVIMNLVVNARDAMPKGGSMTIETTNVKLDETYTTTHPGVAAGRYVMLAVSDTGCGMTAEVKARVFEPFYTTKEVGKGTGLGLSTVYGIIKQSGGSIEIYSEVGKGTTFKIYLPRSEDSRGRVSTKVGTDLLKGGTELILLVEDEDAVRELVQDILEVAGYQVLVARNGNEAISMQSQIKEHISLLITDMVMPGLAGPEVAASLLKNCPDMKVLFMSGYTEHASIRNGILAENMNFINKPFTPVVFSKKVREVLDKKID